MAGLCASAKPVSLISPTLKTPAPFRAQMGSEPHDVPVLAAAKLLRPLGNPPQNSVKVYAASEVIEQAKDRTWLAKVTNALNLYWQRKNTAEKKLVFSNAFLQVSSEDGPK